MADTHPLASRCTTQDAKEARARAPFAKLGSTEDAHRVGIALDRLATVAKRPYTAGRSSLKQPFNESGPPSTAASSANNAECSLTELPHPPAPAASAVW